MKKKRVRPSKVLRVVRDPTEVSECIVGTEDYDVAEVITEVEVIEVE